MRPSKLSVVVFTSGAVVMAFEMVGSRVLAPLFGSSVVVWTALIGIILGALSVGYLLGGRVADKRPDKKWLALILFSSALLIAGMAVVKGDVLLMLANLPGLRLGVTLSALILFAPASVLLGMVSPFAARLALRDVEHSGATVGNLYALSTSGSIVGTFLAGFWLLPVMGHTALLFWLAAILMSIAALLLVSRRQGAAALALAAFFILAAFSTGADAVLNADGDGIDIDTQYARVRIFEDVDWSTSRPVLRMNINNGYSSAMFLDTEDPVDLVYAYTRFYRLADHFVQSASESGALDPLRSPGQVRRALMIGGAAYSYPKSFLATHPDAHLDVVEIDPALTTLAEEYFYLEKDHPRLTIFHEDGRTFLNRAASEEREPYDAMYVDAFSSNAIPYQLASREAVSRMRDLLTEDGVVVVNTISPINGEDGKFFRALYWTYRDVFPRVEIFHVREPYDPKLVGNVMMVAFMREAEPSFESENEEMSAMLDNLWRHGVALDVDIFTDEHNPADYYSSAYLDRVGR